MSSCWSSQYGMLDTDHTQAKRVSYGEQRHWSNVLAINRYSCLGRTTLLLSWYLTYNFFTLLWSCWIIFCACSSKVAPCTIVFLCCQSVLAYLNKKPMRRETHCFPWHGVQCGVWYCQTAEDHFLLTHPESIWYQPIFEDCSQKADVRMASGPQIGG
jgi:hypothetical protein